MNFAAVKKLPVLFVCENNLYSTESPLNVRQPPGTELTERAKAFGIPSLKFDGNDLFGLQRVAAEILAKVRSGGGPFFIECMTYRWREHVGPKFDHELGRKYRSGAELREWQRRCPVARAGAVLCQEGVARERDLEAINDRIQSEIDAAIASARQAPWPDPKHLFEYVY
jgi:pyruvate dehydrogenase E1 component alpha subunit